MKYVTSLKLIMLISSIHIIGKVSLVNILENEHIPGKSARLRILSVENSTQDAVFEIFPALKDSAGLVLSQQTLVLPDHKGVEIDGLYPVIISCTK